VQTEDFSTYMWIERSFVEHFSGMSKALVENVPRLPELRKSDNSP
jgi:hypothetical protein